jgi:phage shock protein E
MKLFRALAVVVVLLLGAPLLAAESGDIVSEQAVVIDVRTRDEWNAGHLQGAVHIPYDVIGAEIGRVVADKTTKIDLYCRSGRRSGIGLETLKQLGYDNVTNLGSMENAATILGRPIVK